MKGSLYVIKIVFEYWGVRAVLFIIKLVFLQPPIPSCSADPLRIYSCVFACVRVCFRVGLRQLDSDNDTKEIFFLNTAYHPQDKQVQS